MKYKYKRVVIASLVAAMFRTNAGGGLPVYGVGAAVDVSEIMYANLDYYGRLDKINVVKECSLNGLTDSTDYGTYLDVTNTSNQAVPALGDGSVAWSFPQAQKERLYYKCTLDEDQITLPQELDVSYRLNGVPFNGDQLAGASGLVEIHIKADPNDDARKYHHSNMMLMIAVLAGMGKCYDAEMEDSQTQNLGETAAVVFTVLPGEERDHTVRIGTDSFKATGVTTAMMSGAAEDLERIKDLKEAKDTWQDVRGKLYDGLEQTAKSVEDMHEGANQICGGLDSVESARRKWNNSEDSTLAGNDQALAFLASVSQQLETMILHLQTAEDSAEVVYEGTGDIVDAFGDIQDPLRELHIRLDNANSNSTGISENIPELMKAMRQLIALDAQLQTSEQVYMTGLASAGVGIGFLDEDYYMDKEDFGRSCGNGDSGNGSSSGRTDSQGRDTDNTGDTTDTDKKNGQSVGGSTSMDGSIDIGGPVGTDNTPGMDDKNSQGTGGSTGVDGSINTGGSAGMDGSAGADSASGTNDKNSQGTDDSAGTDGSVGTGGSIGTDDSTNAGSVSGAPNQNDQGSGSAGSQDNAADGPRGAGTKTDVSAEGTGSGIAAGAGAASGSGAASGAGSTLGLGVASGVDSTSGTSAASDTDAASDAEETLPLTSGSTIMAIIEKHNIPLMGTPEVPVDMEILMELLFGKQSMLTDISKKSSELPLLIFNLMNDTSDLVKYNAEIVDNLDYLIRGLTVFHDSLDTCYPDLQAALDDPQELIRRITDALNNGVSTMTIIQNTLKDSSDDLDAVTRGSLRDSMEFLDRSLNILDSTTAMRRAGRAMEDTINNELDKFGTDDRFLFMDLSSEKVSFTFDKNKAPETLQIVLRTDEVSVDKDDTKTADTEVAKTKESLFCRMRNVLAQMRKAMVSIFKNR